MNRASARGIVIKDDTVLLLYRKKNGQTYYTIPGGQSEIDEKLENTVTRELMEETSVDVKPINLLGKYKQEEFDKFQYLFICEYVKGEPKLGDYIEKEIMQKDDSCYYEPKWVPLKLVSDLTIHPLPVAQAFKGYIEDLVKAKL
ncbi:MAG: MutT/NUDIX family phosphohydrolase [uncultured bacterium]|nr:MAG: MutT/NUDIX family phosphohydrolase [uncultured bacterium]